MKPYELVLLGFEHGITYGERSPKKYGYMSDQRSRRVKLIKKLKELSELGE